MADELTEKAVRTGETHLLHREQLVNAFHKVRRQRDELLAQEKQWIENMAVFRAAFAAMEAQRDALLDIALKLQRLYRGHRDASTYDALLALRDECEAAIAET